MLSSRYFYFSLLGHGLLLVWMMVQIVWMYRMQEQPAAYVQAYSYQLQGGKTVSFPRRREPIHPIHMRQRIAPSPGILFKMGSRLRGNDAGGRKMEAEKTILSILHAAIATKQNYPDSALELKQSGTVQIRFLLYPDGHLEHITVIQSSGIISLDEAALNAVRAISPVKEVGKYLQKEDYFSVNVVFEQ